MLFEFLQTYGNAGGDSGSQILNNFTTSEAFFLIIIIGIIGYIVQAKLRSVFAKYSEIPSPNGMTGAEAAEKMLHDHRIYDVTITHIPGELTDHFNPQTMTVNLSDSVYSGRSISALAVACHECGHAVQHAEEYAPLKLRSSLVPVVNFSSKAAFIFIMIGLVLTASTSSDIVCWIGIAMIAMSAVFSLVTLPVEYNASDRALEWLSSNRILKGEDFDGARIALRWAARTYVVAALSAIATVLYYIAIVNNRRR